MPRKSEAQLNLDSALGNLWCLQELADEGRAIDDGRAALALWHRNAPDARRWVKMVAAAGRTRDLPPDLLGNKAYWNGQGWGIP